MARKIPNEVNQAIWKEYAPDGDCLYVGPLSTGMAQFMPELTQLVAPRGDSNPLGLRHKLKRLFMDVVNARTGRRESPSGDNVAGLGHGRIEFSRDGGQWVFISKERLIHAEPGEILNSIEVVQDLETGETHLYEPTLVGEVRKETTPVIRRDMRFGLHYLLRGDRFRVTFTSRGRTRVLEYKLRPLSEGSSLVGPVVTGDRQEVA